MPYNTALEDKIEDSVYQWDGKQQATRRQKDISRLLREKKNIQKPKPDRPVKKK